MERIEQKAFELASAIAELRENSGYHDYTSTMDEYLYSTRKVG